MAANYPKQKFHATEKPRTVHNEKEERGLGSDWFDTYVHQEYPKCVYYIDGTTKTVQDATELKGLGANWFESPAEAQRAEENLIDGMALSDLLSSKPDAKFVDQYFRRHFEQAHAKEQWRYVREYNENFPLFASESAWASKLLPNLSLASMAPESSRPSARDSMIRDLASDALVRQLLLDVINRFRNLNSSTPRAHFHYRLEGRGYLIDELLKFEFIQQPVNEELLPGLLAFEYCGDPTVLQHAKGTLELILKTLANLFLVNNYKKRRFTFDEVCAHADKICIREVPREEIRLGLLLATRITNFISGYGWTNTAGLSVEWIAVRNEIFDYGSIEETWAAKVNSLNPIRVNSQNDAKLMATTNKSNIFVIHGRNERLRRAMFEFLRALGLNPMEWSELLAKTEKGSPYTGEVIEKGFHEAAAVVALLTPDDYAYLNPDLLTQNDKDYEKLPSPQARPNVLFELGMAFAHHPDRTVIVQIGELRPFSDVAGRHIIHFDGSAEKRAELRDRLRTAGSEPKETGIDWLSTGEFSLKSSSLPHASTEPKTTAPTRADLALKVKIDVMPGEKRHCLRFDPPSPEIRLVEYMDTKGVRVKETFVGGGSHNQQVSVPLDIEALENIFATADTKAQAFAYFSIRITYIKNGMEEQSTLPCRLEHRRTSERATYNSA